MNRSFVEKQLQVNQNYRYWLLWWCKIWWKLVSLNTRIKQIFSIQCFRCINSLHSVSCDILKWASGQVTAPHSSNFCVIHEVVVRTQLFLFRYPSKKDQNARICDKSLYSRQTCAFVPLQHAEEEIVHCIIPPRVVTNKTVFLFKYFSVSMWTYSGTPKTCFTLGLKSFGYIK